ncbi:MAG TPA: magnesium and cobalt transport protein CorA [Ilumatobacteraceae bacterium]|nr:magnesium and cobalt transport protein CorA [Ilumatobacteraceae bacterium]
MRIDCAAYVDGLRRDFDPDTMTIDDPVVGDGFVWLGLRMPDEAELGRGMEALQITGVAAADVLRPHTRPVLTVDGSIVQLVLRTVAYDDRDETIALGEMTLLVGRRAVITVRHGQASQLSSARAALEADPDRLRLGPAAVVAAVVNVVIDGYAPALDGFENDVIEVERDVFSDSNRQPVQRLYKLKREVRRMIVAIDSLDDPLARLIRVRGSQMPPPILHDLNEAGDQLDRAVTRAHSLSGLLDAALTASLTQITVRQNDDMRKISAWVAMAAVPTMVAGIYGMNFEHMPELDWLFGYPLVLTFTALAVGLLHRQFKKSGWL